MREAKNSIKMKCPKCKSSWVGVSYFDYGTHENYWIDSQLWDESYWLPENRIKEGLPPLTESPRLRCYVCDYNFIIKFSQLRR